MRILFTNSTLSIRAGTELYVRDVALALVGRGHQIVAYSTVLGAVAEELRENGVAVVDNLDKLPWRPDVLHGHHHPETMTALLHLGNVPAIYVCHGFIPWKETPPRHPRIMRYVVVDQMTRDAAVHEHGVSPEQIRLIPSFVDLAKFHRRSTLPKRPCRALLFNNDATPSLIYPNVLAGCRLRDVQLDAVGRGMGNPIEHPESLLGQYDLVFAKGRCALEAMACGSAVVVCGRNGIGPMVDSADFDRLWLMNFGAKSLMREATPAAVAEEIDRYEAADAALLMERVRREASLDGAVETLLMLYQEVIAEFAATPGISSKGDAAAARYVADLAKLTKRFHRRRERGPEQPTE